MIPEPQPYDPDDPDFYDETTEEPTARKSASAPKVAA